MQQKRCATFLLLFLFRQCIFCAKGGFEVKSRIGPPATGDDFFPRSSVTARLHRALRRGNVAFLGPRRTGKTSILKALQAHPPAGSVGVFINLEKHHAVTDWLEEMIGKTKSLVEEPSPDRPWVKNTTRAFTAFLKRIESVTVPGIGGFKLSPLAAKEWRPTADAFLQLLTESGAPILYLLDEFPWFLDLVAKKSSPAEVEAVLAWFRHARQELADHPARFLVTGSIGLDGLVRRLGLSPTINEFDTVEIPPLKDSEALAFLDQLARDEGVKLSAGGRACILRLLGTNWPILLQLFVSEIQEWQLATQKGAPTNAELRRIYRDGLAGGSRNKYCSGMWDRLPKVFSLSEVRLAREILKELRFLPAGMAREEVEAIHARLVPDDTHRAHVAAELDYVLDTLKHDGYVLQLLQHGHRISFASNMLRDYWARRLA